MWAEGHSRMTSETDQSYKRMAWPLNRMESDAWTGFVGWEQELRIQKVGGYVSSTAVLLSVVAGLAAEVSPGNLLETHPLELQLKPSQ